MKKVLLRSSGIDSHCIEYLESPDISVYFDLHHEYNKEELKHLPEHVVIDDMLDLGAHIKDNYILPRRNAFLILGAAFYGDVVMLGTTAGDSTKDKDDGFIVRMNELLAYMGNDPGKCTHVRIVAPYMGTTKRDIVKQYVNNGGDVTSLLNTRSCYNIQERECGVCRSCLRKYVALFLNGIDCSSFMEIHPRLNLDDALAYAIKQNRGDEINDIQEVLEQC